MSSGRRRSALVVGLGRFGTAAAERLTTLGWDVAGVDIDPEVVQNMRDRMAHVVELDASDEEALADLSVAEFDVCIVSRGGARIESSLLLVLNLQALGAVKIVAKASTKHHARILRRLGVDEIVFPEGDAGIRLAEQIQSPNLLQWIQISDERDLAALRVPDERAGSLISDWWRLNTPSLSILGHLDPAGRIMDFHPDTPLSRDEILVVVGPLDEILKLGS